MPPVVVDGKDVEPSYGDLSPLLRLSHLSEIRMRDRREYRPRLAEVKEQLDCD